MARHRPFIPCDKPKFFILAVLACFVGLVAGALLFALSFLGVRWAEALFQATFWLAWFVMAFCMVGFLAKQWTGKYEGLQERAWKEQVW